MRVKRMQNNLEEHVDLIHKEEDAASDKLPFTLITNWHGRWRDSHSPPLPLSGGELNLWGRSIKQVHFKKKAKTSLIINEGGKG